MGKIENDVYVDDCYLNLDRKNGIKPMLRLTLKKNEKFFGPGVATLLHLIDREKSIQTACGIMEMSYSKAWKILKRAENELGFPLLNSRNGGANGGQSELTAEAKRFLAAYDAISEKLQQQAGILYSEYFGKEEQEKQ